MEAGGAEELGTALDAGVGLTGEAPGEPDPESAADSWASGSPDSEQADGSALADVTVGVVGACAGSTVEGARSTNPGHAEVSKVRVACSSAGGLDEGAPRVAAAPRAPAIASEVLAMTAPLLE